MTSKANKPIRLHEITEDHLILARKLADESGLPMDVYPSTYFGPNSMGTLYRLTHTCFGGKPPIDSVPNSHPFLTVLPARYYVR